MTRARPTFAPWWQPWRRCRARTYRVTRHHYGRHACFDGRCDVCLDDEGRDLLHPQRCRLPRHHLNRHATYDGFDIRYFDARNEGTP